MRCPHCGHDTERPSGSSGLMAMQTSQTDWRLVAWTALFVVSVVVAVAAAHAGVGL